MNLDFTLRNIKTAESGSVTDNTVEREKYRTYPDWPQPLWSLSPPRRTPPQCRCTGEAAAHPRWLTNNKKKWEAMVGTILKNQDFTYSVISNQE
jgi:hypothetical protein